MKSAPYRCFILDDEPLALRVIEGYLSKFPQFEVCGTSTEPLEAIGLIRQLRPDLLFLDIQMPDITGLELIESVEQKPEIIITTAYREHAVDGFEKNVLDYLVKPIPLARFVKAIDRFLEKKGSHHTAYATDAPSHIYVKADRKTVRIILDEILYVEGVKDYVKIVQAHQQTITKTSLGNFFKELPGAQFIQVHKSFIVAKDKITAYTAQDVEIGKTEIPIGRMYKDTFLSEMENK